MHCPFCGNDETKVLESRQVEEGTAVRRRRECDHCSRRFTTFEKYEDMPLVVVKKDGRREEFSRGKLKAGILRACEKRPVSVEQIETMAYEIEKNLRNGHDREVPSKSIGEAVMNNLVHLDEVAYIRFASVYREFKDVQRFLQELHELVEKKGNN
ncbi:transcriptional regulator NrdR [Desulfitobacterium dichloroeliminans LMG P-21439]|uniref:Transcriptional repressor NrdR n=1 Tax=Desulfitobacterium dichloroeliminans (strain LMG P-21439 / DCA1) TaxID=871963 RepID=L0F1R3_DESDL|nr:transcriptional regulator NrdR [Desulfitobacterium dichloroeliminans]AGA67804.1 transcriptional regulator NrdR [Desulfitobacterium dichloroeliminans LMG P-21439]